MDCKSDHPEPGSPERFVELLQPIQTGLLRYARSLANDRESARDLVSEAIAATYPRFKELRNELALKGYLYKTVKFLAIQHRARASRHQDLESAQQQADPQASPEVLTDIRLLQAALAQLPDAQRDAIVWKDLSGLSLEEIRELQGGSLSAVKMRLVRGREELARLLGESPKKSKHIRSKVGPQSLVTSAILSAFL